MRLLILTVLLMSLSNFAAAKDYIRTIKYYSTMPRCGPFEYEVPAELRDGSQRAHTVANVFCLHSDHIANRYSVAQQQFQAMFFSEPNTLRSVLIHAWAFDDIPLLDKICGAAAASRATIELLEYKNPKRPIPPTPPRCVTATLARFPVRWASGIKVFHPKAYAAVKDDKVELMVSSGHPHRGFSLNFEFWLYMGMKPDDPLWMKHVCFFKANRLVAEEQVGLLPAYQLFHNCGQQITFPAGSAIQPYFLPYELVAFRTEIESLAANAAEIQLSALGVGSEWLSLVLRRSLSNGATVRFVADDDALWAGNECAGDCLGEETSRSGWIEPLQNSGMLLRYLETNHACRGNFLHHKLMIFKLKTGEVVSVVGSANFTDAAFQQEPVVRLSANIENEYLLRGAVANDAARNFEEIWNLATPPERLPKLDLKRVLKGRNC